VQGHDWFFQLKLLSPFHRLLLSSFNKQITHSPPLSLTHHHCRRRSLSPPPSPPLYVTSTIAAIICQPDHHHCSHQAAARARVVFPYLCFMLQICCASFLLLGEGRWWLESCRGERKRLTVVVLEMRERKKETKSKKIKEGKIPYKNTYGVCIVFTFCVHLS